MKSLSIVLICLLGFMISCGNNAEEPVSTTGDSSSKKGFNYKIAYVNADSLLENYSYYKDIRNVLDVKRKEMTNQIQDRRDALNREVDDYQRSANTLTTDQRALAEQRLIRKNKEFQQFAQNLERSIVENEGEQTQKLQEKVQDFMTKYARENGYQFILSTGQGSGVLYADETFEVTKQVLNSLNAQYDIAGVK